MVSSYALQGSLCSAQGENTSGREGRGCSGAGTEGAVDPLKAGESVGSDRGREGG